MNYLSRWALRLGAQEEAGVLRTLRAMPVGWVDFCSNDFLGLAASGGVVGDGPIPAGATGSRLISGQYAALEELEAWAAGWLGVEACLFFASGYQANLALMQALATRQDTILLDARIHASLADGGRLAQVRAVHRFCHNDAEELEAWLARTRRAAPEGDIYVVTESIFSMAATSPPLAAFAELCERYRACLILDEAHALGLAGGQGQGLAEALGLADRVPVRVLPMGKAAGCQGALVAGPQSLKELLVNFARPFIYTTGPAPVLVAQAHRQLRRLAGAAGEAARTALAERIAVWEGYLPDAHISQVPGLHPIRPVLLGAGPGELLGACERHGYYVRPIRYPTVPRGEECLRITLRADTPLEDVERMAGIVAEARCHL